MVVSPGLFSCPRRVTASGTLTTRLIMVADMFPHTMQEQQ